MKRLLALALILCCISGCTRAEQGSWTQEEWQTVLDALVSDEADPVPESRRVSFRSDWLSVEEEGFANILLMSSDSLDIEKNFGRASAMMICRVDLKTGNTRLLSLPEDALVTLPEAPEAIPLRYVNCFGGPGLTARCLNEALDLRISRYCAINIMAFIESVDTLGGVNMELTEEEAQALELKPGSQMLSGEQALMYMKLRQPNDGSGRVRALLSAILRQTIENASLSQAMRLIDILLHGVNTNLTMDNLLDLVFALFSQQQPASIEALGVAAESGSLDDGLKAQCKTFLYGEE
ncbi:MAG: LCP family protein [Clostridia bacterium]|nr:LCP family protein [Clostridia bacterium]